MTKNHRYLVTRIRELTLSGVRQSDIARILCISRITVREYQRELGLPTRQTKMVPSVESYSIILRALDSIFPDGLPFPQELDAPAADKILSALQQRRPSYFKMYTKSNTAEFRQLIESSLFLKRACSDGAHGTVH
jgi:hypothetical protein